VNDHHQRRELLNLWVSDFTFEYKPDNVVDIELRTIAEGMIAKEAAEGTRLLSNPFGLVGWEDKPPLYDYARKRATEWEMPITQLGLLMAIFGCHNAAHVDMVLAVLYKQYTNRRSTSDKLIDTIFAWETFEQGIPSEDFLAQMWEKQRIAGEGGSAENLLEKVRASDFQ
jgi:hypothetical protein